MSGKNNSSRKNLGTVVEETVDDSTSPLLNINRKNKKESVIEDGELISIEKISIDDTFNQNQQQNLKTKEEVQQNTKNTRRHRSVLNVINFLNNIAAPVRDNRNKSRGSISSFGGSTTYRQSSYIPSSSIESSSSKFDVNQMDFDENIENINENDSKKYYSDSMSPLAHETAVAGSSTNINKKMKECPLCYCKQPQTQFPKLTNCSHRSCKSCLAKYLQVEIMESRVNISCPECSEPMHQNDIYSILSKQKSLLEKYENFSLRRVLMTDPDIRWCPAPDCTYAVIATSCAACPQLKCERPGCNTLFCYHCKGIWHNNQTCDEARRERAARMPSNDNVGSALSGPFLMDRDSFLKPGDVKACPRCKTLIVKLNDGSCNHMVCAMCGAEFCWLCLKVITDLHYLSPTGCTFWGKRPWTKKKKLLWQIGILIGAPVGIALIGGLAVPGIIFGVPVFIGRKAYQKFEHLSKFKRRLITATSVVGSLIVSPVLAVMAVGVGVPIMLAYVYGVVPLSLCRNGACGNAESPDDENPYGNRDEEEEIAHLTSAYAQAANERSKLIDKQDGTSVKTGFSINSGLSSEVISNNGHRSSTTGTTSCKIHIHDHHSKRRPSIESGITSLGEKINFDGASVNAMAGSRYDNKSVHTIYSDGQEVYDESGSTKALAGSVLDTKSLTDSCGKHNIIKEREMSPNMFDDNHKTEDEISCSSNNKKAKLNDNNMYRKKSKTSINQHVNSEDLQPVEFYCAENMPGPSLARQSTNSDIEDGADPYKVHAIMDNIKQILSDDIADIDRPKKVVKNFKKNPNANKAKPSVKRSSSSKSYGQSVTAQINDNQVVIVPSTSTVIQMPDEDARSRTSSIATSTIPHFSSSDEETKPPKRSIFSRLFKRNKN